MMGSTKSKSAPSGGPGMRVAIFGVFAAVMIAMAGWHLTRPEPVVPPAPEPEPDIEVTVANDLQRLRSLPYTKAHRAQPPDPTPAPSASFVVRPTEPARPAEPPPSQTYQPAYEPPRQAPRASSSDPGRKYTTADCQYILSGMRTSASQELKDQCDRMREGQRQEDNRRASPNYRGR
jgi:hypothetical protein